MTLSSDLKNTYSSIGNKEQLQMNVLNKPPVERQNSTDSHEEQMDNLLDTMAANLNRMSQDENYRKEVAARATTPQDSSKKPS